jgi:formylmethanofuran dehydrogenase subunit E
MEGNVEKRPSAADEEAIFSDRCSQCGGVIHTGRELVLDGKQILCEGCYRFLVNPDSEGDIPSKWF